MTAHLKDENYWTVIQTLIDDWAAAVETAKKFKKMTEDSKPEKSILQHKIMMTKDKEAVRNDDWQKTNYQTVLTLLSIIFKMNQQAVENLKYAGDIWLYITKYIQANYSTLTFTFSSYFRWEKNEAQFIKKAAREIEYLANQIS